MNVFLDDARPCPDNYFLVRDASNLITFLEYLKPSKQRVDTLSLDHDLGEGMDGYSLVKYLVNYLPLAFDYIDHVQVHSSNVVGRDNILNFLKMAQDKGRISKQTFIDTRIYREKDNKLEVVG